ncbi:uncharacterized protein LOC105183316 isoform X1 [Harpegnathos saltator]|uniref:uncharacterized protein LOC105183316 isoform X1 n=1 Tax=Harpegnathos saltator TaxID=610380 RepID=UPI000948EB2E|nr:uncharacterized protein LOC105183316 isoform X1 [Harpegnathos saltator]
MMQYIQTHLKLNRVLLLVLGLWPYQRLKIVRCQFVFVFGILLTYILSQLGVFITLQCTTDLVLNILFVSFFTVTSVIKYISFYINSEAVKSLIEQIQRNYDKLKDERETAILNKYGNKAKYYTTVFTVLFIFLSSICFLLQLWPCIFNMFTPANTTRSIHRLRFISEYFIGQEKHFYIILLHANIAMFISSLTLLSTGVMLLSFGLHICGMFKIVSYHIKHATRINGSRPISPHKKNFTYVKMVYAVDIHRKTLQFSESLMSTFALWFFLLIGAGVISMSLNLMQIFITLSSGHNVEELTIQVVFLFVQYTYMFLANYVAQEVTDHNNHVFTTIYNIQWYVTPLHMQKMILFLLQRGTKPYYLQLGILFVGSLEGFASLSIFNWEGLTWFIRFILNYKGIAMSKKIYSDVQ